MGNRDRNYLFLEPLMIRGLPSRNTKNEAAPGLAPGGMLPKHLKQQLKLAVLANIAAVIGQYSIITDKLQIGGDIIRL